MKTMNVWERQLNEVREDIKFLEESIKYYSDIANAVGLTEYEEGMLRHTQIELKKKISKLHMLRLEYERDYNLEALGHYCPVPMEDEYYERKLKTEGYIVCIKF